MKKLNVNIKRKLTKEDKRKILRLVIFGIVLVVIILFSFKLFDVVNKLSDEVYRLKFEQKVIDMGFLRSTSRNRTSNRTNLCSGYPWTTS